MALYHKLSLPHFDGQMLHFTAEWSEDADDWATVFSTAFTVPGWVDEDGQAVFDERFLVQALEQQEAQVAAYLEAKRNPPQVSEDLAGIIRKPMTLADLTERVAAARRANGGGLTR